MAENIITSAGIGRDEIAHILDDAEQRHLHLAEHGDALARIDQRQILRRGDDDRAGKRHLLGDRELRIARAGRHVQHQHIQFAPGNFAQHLHQCRLHHRPAPDHRRFLIHQKTHGHDLQSIIFHGKDDAVFLLLRTAGNFQQSRQRRAVNIGIEHADLEAERLETERQIDRGGGLAHPALARGHGDDGPHAWHAHL
ncbi:hypothetical protein D3C72_1672250 [compost metagenome]